MEIFIAAMRGRPNGHGNNVQRLEVNEHGTSNTITTVTKDNMVLEMDTIDYVSIGYTRDYANHSRTYHIKADGITNTIHASTGGGVTQINTLWKWENKNTELENSLLRSVSA